MEQELGKEMLNGYLLILMTKGKETIGERLVRDRL